MNQNPRETCGGIIATVTTLGLRLWEKLLYKVVVILLVLVAIQVLLFAGLTAVGYIPPRLADISLLQLLAILVCSSSMTLLAVLGVPTLMDRRRLATHNGRFLKMAIPLRVEHECVIFQFGQRFLGLGYILLPQDWSDGIGNKMLKTLAELECAVTLQIARSHEGREFCFLVVNRVSEDLDELVSEIIKACEALHGALTKNGVLAEWVKDRLGIEQLYWLCVLGKGFGDDVFLQCEENLVVAQVGEEKPRLLVALNMMQDRHVVVRQRRSPVEVLDILHKNRPFLLSFALHPIAPEIVAEMLRQIAFEAPELSLLVEALGETAALQVYGESNETIIKKITTLLDGREEGLWQYNYRLICQLTDAPILTDALETSPYLLRCKGFTEMAICSPATHQWIDTNRLLNMLTMVPTLRDTKHDNSYNGR